MLFVYRVGLLFCVINYGVFWDWQHGFCFVLFFIGLVNMLSSAVCSWGNRGGCLWVFSVCIDGKAVGRAIFQNTICCIRVLQQ